MALVDRINDLATRIAQEFVARSPRAATVSIPVPVMVAVVSVTDADVSPSSVVRAWLAPASFSDENDPETLGPASLTAAPGAGEFTLTLAFNEAVSGPVKINYEVA